MPPPSVSDHSIRARVTAASKDGPLQVLVVGPGADGRGGVASVIRAHLAALGSDRLSVRAVASHRDRGAVGKAAAFAGALAGVLRWLLATSGPRIVHIHSGVHASFRRKSLVARLARAFGVPYVVHLHSGAFKVFYESEVPPRIRRRIDRYFLGASHVIVLSRRAEEFVSATWPAVPVTRIENAIDTDARRAVPVRSGPLDCIFVGRLGAPKGLSEIVAVIHRMAAARRPVRFVLCGDGDVEATRAALAREIASGTATVTGWMDHPAILARLREAHVLLLPSFSEGLPMSMLEGMAYGLAPVVTPVGGIPDVIEHMRNGLLVPPGAADELERAIDALERDDELRRRLATAAKDVVERDYSLHTHVEKVRRVYADVLAAARPARPAGESVAPARR